MLFIEGFFYVFADKATTLFAPCSASMRSEYLTDPMSDPNTSAVAGIFLKPFFKLAKKVLRYTGIGLHVCN